MKSFFLNSHASSKIFLSIKPVSLVIDCFHLSTRLSAGKEESLNRWRLRFPLYLVASEEKKNVKIKDSNVIYIFHLTRYATSEKIDQKMQNFKIAVHLEKFERGTFVIVSLIEKYPLSKVFVTFGRSLFPSKSKVSVRPDFQRLTRYRPVPLSETLFDSKAICAWNWQRERTDARPSGQTMKRITCAPARPPTL